MGIREQVLDDCQLLFGQEVKIITFSGARTNDWHAVVVPKAWSLRSLTQYDTSGKILLKVTCSSRSTSLDTTETLHHLLHAAVGKRIGRIFQADHSGSTQSANPTENNTAGTPFSTEVAESSTSPNSPHPAPTTGKGFKAEKDEEQEKMFKGKEKSALVVKDKGWRVEEDGLPYTSNLDINEYEPEAPDADDPEIHSTSFPEQSVVENALVESVRTLGSSEMSYTDFHMTQMSEPFDPAETNPQMEMMRNEIKASMRRLLMCLTEHIDGM